MSRCRHFRPVPGSYTLYHLIMRTHGGQHLFKPFEREVFVRMLHKVAAFSGVEVLNYCILSNHYHLLVRIYTPLPGEKVDLNILLARYQALYGQEPCRGSGYPALHRLKEVFGGDDAALAEFWRLRLEARMNDVSIFMKTLNQRFTTWYNATHDHFGTLWAQRFKDVVVEDEPCARSVVSAYLDLNPVRAGIVEDPVDYRWSGFAAAMAGQLIEQAGLCAVTGEMHWKHTMRAYRRFLYVKGSIRKEGSAAIASEKVDRVESVKGNISIAQQLRLRLRFISRGAFLGSETFVARLSKKRREQLGRIYRPRMPGLVKLATDQHLFALRYWEDPALERS